MAIKTYSFVVVGNVNDGQKGDQGYGVQKATPQYYLSSSSTALTNGTWTYTKPSIPSGKYLWTRIQTTIDNPGKTKIYSDAVYDASTTGLSQTVDQNTQKITSKVWQTDITSSINSYDGSTGKAIRDRVTKTETDIGGLKTTVSDHTSKIATKADGTTVEALTNRVSKNEQDAASFKTTVSKTYSTKDETSAVSSIANQTADKISWLIDSKATATSLVLTDSAINAVTDKMTITGSDGSTTIISGGSLHAGSITTNDLAANAIKSKNYVAPSRSTSPFSSAGSFFDLSNGNIQTPSFGVRTSYTSSDPLDDQGNAFINGRIVAQSGQIGRNSTNYWAIGNSVDYNANESASIVGHGTAYIQSGNWQISNNSINTQAYNSSHAITYPHYNGHYYDYGMKVPDLDPSASGYNDTSGVWLYARRSASDKVPTVYSDWNYLFRVDKDGTIYENGVKLSDRYASIADVGSAYLSTKNGGTVNGNVTITGNLTATASNAKQVANALTVNGNTFNGSAAVNVGTIGVSYGGTGRTSWTSGTLLYASGSTVLSSLGAGANGSFLISHGNGAAPVWTDPSNLTVGNANHVYASGIRWGNQSIAGDVSPIDAAMYDGMASNVLSFANPSGITVEYSNNGGSTWTAYPATDANKITLVTPGIPMTWWHLGNKTTAQSSNADQLRITFDARSMGVYCSARSLMINVCSGGANNLSVKIETANSQSLTTFTTRGTYPLEGWSGWNSIPWLLDVFGTNGHDNQPVIARMTFSFPGYNSGWESKTDCVIGQILMFATNKWATPSNYATSGHLYQMDTSQNAYFPAQIKASAFNGNASTATKLATARTVSLSGAITGSGTFDGSNNLAITTSVGNLSYLPLSGGTVTGNLTVNGTITGHISGNASTATTWQTARTLTVGNTGKSVNGSANVSWSKAEISGDATNTANGWMSAADKKKLDSITVSQIGMVGANSIVGAGDVKVTITNGIATVEHANKSITAGTVSGGSGTLSNGGSFTIPKVTYDAYGHITGTGTTSVTLPMITSISGNAATATKLASARTISLSGAITGSGTFDGSNNLEITTSVGNLSYLPLSGGTVTGNLTVNGTITGNLSGNASTATKATQDGNGSVISSTYLKLAGGTMVSGAKINFVSNSSTVSDAISGGSSINVEGNGSAYSGWISGNTKLGRMAIATNPGNDENLYFAYNNSELAIYITTQDEVLTAHVVQGGLELSSDDIAKLGAIHWYASGGTEILATGATYKASGAVVNLEARLEA